VHTTVVREVMAVTGMKAGA